MIGEEQVVEAADLLVANTDTEARQLIDLYDARPEAVEVIHPGVDLTVFRPHGQGGGPSHARPARGRDRAALRRADPAAQGARRAAAAVGVLLDQDPSLRHRLVVPVVGGPSGSGLEHPDSLAELAADLGITDVVRFVPPVTQPQLAIWSAAATAVAVPSYNESFGLVAVEAQATGTPVVAAAVGGLTTVVQDGVSGLLVDTHEPRDWAASLRRLIDDPALVERLGAGALRHAQEFSWERTAERTLAAYDRANSLMRAQMAS